MNGDELKKEELRSNGSSNSSTGSENPTPIELNTYFIKIIDHLLKIFKKDPGLLENRAAFIIRSASVFTGRVGACA